MRTSWHEYDTVAPIQDVVRRSHLFLVQSTADVFFEEQLITGVLAVACAKSGLKTEIRMQKRYDLSYYLTSTFMAEHVAWHAERMR